MNTNELKSFNDNKAIIESMTNKTEQTQAISQKIQDCAQSGNFELMAKYTNLLKSLIQPEISRATAEELAAMRSENEQDTYTAISNLIATYEGLIGLLRTKRDSMPKIDVTNSTIYYGNLKSVSKWAQRQQVAIVKMRDTLNRPTIGGNRVMLLRDKTDAELSESDENDTTE